MSALIEFESKFRRGQPDECWEWDGCRNGKGYGQFCNTRAHRFSYMVYVGKIPDGLFVCHHCDNPPCVNPAHLYAGTAKDNVRDCIARGRFAGNQRGETCHAGHPWTEESRIIRPSGNWRCRICKQAKWKLIQNDRYNQRQAERCAKITAASDPMVAPEGTLITVGQEWLEIDRRPRTVKVTAFDSCNRKIQLNGKWWASAWRFTGKSGGYQILTGENK